MLIEGWATAAAYEIASALADDDTIDVEGLVGAGVLPEALRPWLNNILLNLEAAALAKRAGAAWTLIDDPSLPSSASVVRALATEQQSRAGELLLAAALSGFAGKLAKNRALIAAESIISKSALDFYNATDIAAREASEALYRTLIQNNGFWPTDRALRVLQVGFSPLSQMLLSSPHGGRIQLTVFEPDRRRYESADLALGKNRDVKLVDADHAGELGKFDLIVSAGGLHRLPEKFSVADLKALLAPRGLLAAIEPRPSLFKDLVFGLDPAWFALGQNERPISSLRPAAHWPAHARTGGLPQSRSQSHPGRFKPCRSHRRGGRCR